MIKNFQNNKFNFSNAYIHIKRNKEAILIDTAASGEKIINYCIDHDIKIKYVLLTHNHLDHVIDLDKIIAKFNPIIYINQNDFLGLFDPKINRSFFANLDWKLKNKDNIISFAANSKQKINLLGINIKIIPVSGHTAGSTFYLFDNQDIFIGDTLFLKGIGMHQKELKVDLKKFMRSIKFIYHLAKENDYLIYPGHYQSGFRIKDIDLNLNSELKEILR
ncbi:MAG: Zn-dependent hydrolase/glyoxylase [Candidatus Hepatoplasma scabrum]|nr:MAG: Zn-dependent hydrolase/glyoxylase [Candidatus Hepatoplasma sp.]